MFLSKGSTAPTTAIPSLLNVMMELRKCCNHPFLIKGMWVVLLAPVCGQHQRLQLQLCEEGERRGTDVHVDAFIHVRGYNTACVCRAQGI